MHLFQRLHVDCSILKKQYSVSNRRYFTLITNFSPQNLSIFCIIFGAFLIHIYYLLFQVSTTIRKFAKINDLFPSVSIQFSSHLNLTYCTNRCHQNCFNPSKIVYYFNNKNLGQSISLKSNHTQILSLVRTIRTINCVCHSFCYFMACAAHLLRTQ